MPSYFYGGHWRSSNWARSIVHHGGTPSAIFYLTASWTAFYIENPSFNALAPVIEDEQAFLWFTFNLRYWKRNIEYSLPKVRISQMWSAYRSAARWHIEASMGMMCVTCDCDYAWVNKCTQTYWGWRIFIALSLLLPSPSLLLSVSYLHINKKCLHGLQITKLWRKFCVPSMTLPTWPLLPNVPLLLSAIFYAAILVQNADCGSQKLNSFTRIAEYIAYLAYILSVMIHEEDRIRTIAGYLLKNNSRLILQAQPPVVEFVKSAVLQAFDDPSIMIRNAASQDIVAFLGVLEPRNWPECLQQLVNALDASDLDRQEVSDLLTHSVLGAGFLPQPVIQSALSYL